MRYHFVLEGTLSIEIAIQRSEKEMMIMIYFRVIIKFTNSVYPSDSEPCARHSIVASKHGGVWILSSPYVH